MSEIKMPADIEARAIALVGPLPRAGGSTEAGSKSRLGVLLRDLEAAQHRGDRRRKRPGVSRRTSAGSSGRARKTGEQQPSKSRGVTISDCKTTATTSLEGRRCNVA